MENENTESQAEDSFRKYHHIDTFNKVSSLYGVDRVVITEKIHGANSRIGWIDGRLRIGARNIELDEKNTGYEFYNWVLSLEPGLSELLERLFGDEDAVIYGEWCGPGIQKGISYGSEKRFFVFDVFVGDDFVGFDEVRLIASVFGLSTVPVLYDGPFDVEVAMGLRSGASIVATAAGVTGDLAIREGVVIKPAEPLRNERGNLIVAKLKDERFEERKSLRKSPLNPVNPEAIAFADEWVTPMRLHHVLQQIEESGESTDSMRCIGSVLRTMNQDIIREGEIDPEQWKVVAKSVTTATKNLFQRHLSGEDLLL